MLIIKETKVTPASLFSEFIVDDQKIIIIIKIMCQKVIISWAEESIKIVSVLE